MSSLPELSRCPPDNYCQQDGIVAGSIPVQRRAELGRGPVPLPLSEPRVVHKNNWIYSSSENTLNGLTTPRACASEGQGKAD